MGFHENLVHVSPDRVILIVTMRASRQMHGDAEPVRMREVHRVDASGDRAFDLLHGIANCLFATGGAEDDERLRTVRSPP
ncbi:MAG: hypothetical protein V4813_07660 [Gemmatimonadota bacterium]